MCPLSQCRGTSLRLLHYQWEARGTHEYCSSQCMHTPHHTDTTYLTSDSQCVAQLSLSRPKLPKHLCDGPSLHPTYRTIPRSCPSPFPGHSPYIIQVFLMDIRQFQIYKLLYGFSDLRFKELNFPDKETFILINREKYKSNHRMHAQLLCYVMTLYK